MDINVGSVWATVFLCNIRGGLCGILYSYYSAYMVNRYGLRHFKCSLCTMDVYEILVSQLSVMRGQSNGLRYSSYSFCILDLCGLRYSNYLIIDCVVSTRCIDPYSSFLYTRCICMGSDIPDILHAGYIVKIFSNTIVNEEYDRGFSHHRQSFKRQLSRHTTTRQTERVSHSTSRIVQIRLKASLAT